MSLVTTTPDRPAKQVHPLGTLMPVEFEGHGTAAKK